MDTYKYHLLVETINSFLERNEVGDGKDGWYHDALADRMASAAEAVYDSTMEIQYFMCTEGLEPGLKDEE